MPYFEWTTQLDVGVDAMNDQHQRLIDIMNLLHQRVADKAPRDEIAGLVKSLADYTVRHFRAEESYMESLSYAGLARHRRIHEELLATLADHRRAFEQGATLGDEFFAFLKLWLSAHIKGIDKKYAPGACSASGRAA